jgi:hypothetical protein
MSIKNPNDTIGNRTLDLPAFSAVPQPTAPPIAPLSSEWWGEIRALDTCITWHLYHLTLKIWSNRKKRNLNFGTLQISNNYFPVYSVRLQNPTALGDRLVHLVDWACPMRITVLRTHGFRASNLILRNFTLPKCDSSLRVEVERQRENDTR